MLLNIHTETLTAQELHVTVTSLLCSVLSQVRSCKLFVPPTGLSTSSSSPSSRSSCSSRCSLVLFRLRSYNRYALSHRQVTLEHLLLKQEVHAACNCLKVGQPAAYPACDWSIIGQELFFHDLHGIEADEQLTCGEFERWQIKYHK